MTDTCIPSGPDNSKLKIKRPRLSDWVWKPRYAKVWWFLTAVYWGVGALGFIFQPILDLYMTDVAYLLHVVFYPVFAFVIRALGWMRAWMLALDLVDTNPESVGQLGWSWSNESDTLLDREWRAHTDPTNIFSPLSGSMYVGNTNNPMHPAYHR